MFENSDEEIDFDEDIPLTSNITFNPEKENIGANFKKPEEIRKVSPPNRKVVKRKFPGPAGLLPECNNYDSIVLEDCTKNQSNEIPCSQMTVSVFNEKPWVEATTEYNRLASRYNIKWIKEKANKNELLQEKAPFLVAMVQNIECFEDKKSMVNVTLKDETDTIQGTVLYRLYEEYSESFITGSVLILKQFGVFTTGYYSDPHITITAKNLIAIYAKKDGAAAADGDDDDDQEDDEVKKIVLMPFSEENLLIEDNKNKNKQRFSFKRDVNGALKNKVERTNLENITVNCSQSQLSIQSKPEDKKIWEEVFEDVDADSLFDDF